MQILEKIKALPLEKRKNVLYKIAEIYSEDEELLNFIDNLQWEDQVNFVCDVLFSGKENREKLWMETDIEIKHILEKLQQENIKANLLSLEIEELVKKQEAEHTLDIDKALDDAFNFTD